MPTDRMAELRRQRALVQQHLDWLDREIATLSGTSAPATAPPVETKPIATATGTDVDGLFEQLRAHERAKIPSAKGCWRAFWGTLATILVVVAVIIYFRYYW